MSYAPGGGLPIDLANALAAVVALAFALLPAFGLAWGLGRRAGWPLGRILGLDFATTLFVVGILSLAAHYAHLSLTFVLGASALTFAALTVLGLRLGKGTELPRSDWQGLLVAGGAGVVALFERPWFTPADTFYHLAAIRSLLVFDRPAVTDPLYGTKLDVLDPTSGVWHSFLALASRATHLDPAWLWPGATVVGAMMTALGMWVLCRVVSRSPTGATVATLAFLVLSMHLDMRWGAYPNRMSLSMVFFGLTAAVGLIDRPRYVLADAALAVAAGFAAISLHLAAAAVMLLVTLYLTVIVGLDVLDQRVRQARWEWRPFVALAATGAALLVVALPMLVPKADVVAASPLVTYTGGLGGMVKENWPLGLLSARTLMIGAGVWPQYVGAAIGFVALLAGFLRDDRRALAAGTIGTFTAVVFLDPLVATSLLSRSAYLSLRIAILLPFAVFVPLAWGFGQLGRARSYCPGDRTRPLSVVGFALAALGLAVTARVGAVPVRDLFRPIKAHGVLGVPLSRARDVRLVWGAEAVAAVARATAGGYPVIAGTGETAYELAGLMPVALAAAPEKHAPFAFERIDGAQRRSDVALLLEPSASAAVRREIVRRRGIDFVVVDTRAEKDRAVAEALHSEPALFERVVDSPTLVLFRVRR